MRLHDSFEWDEDKAATNLKKHGVSFEDAARVLRDEEGDFYHVEEFDWKHSNGEDRDITTGSLPDDRRIVIRISWTSRFRNNARITRIISARPVTPFERRKYAQKISSR